MDLEKVRYYVLETQQHCHAERTNEAVEALALAFANYTIAAEKEFDEIKRLIRAGNGDFSKAWAALETKKSARGPAKATD